MGSVAIWKYCQKWTELQNTLTIWQTELDRFREPLTYLITKECSYNGGNSFLPFSPCGEFLVFCWLIRFYFVFRTCNKVVQHVPDKRCCIYYSFNPVCWIKTITKLSAWRKRMKSEMKQLTQDLNTNGVQLGLLPAMDPYCLSLNRARPELP